MTKDRPEHSHFMQDLWRDPDYQARQRASRKAAGEVRRGKTPRTRIACAVPGCPRMIELTSYQMSHRKYPPACSRPHSRLLLSLHGVRGDDAGKFLSELVVTAGGLDLLADQLECHRTGLQLLMRKEGRIPYVPIMAKLAEVSGRTPDEIRAIFGPRAEPRTNEIINTVKARFPLGRKFSRARRAVVDTMERERLTVRAYAAAVDVSEESLRLWLLGEHQSLEPEARRAITKHEHLPLEGVRAAKEVRAKVLAFGRRKFFRGKRSSPQWKQKHKKSELMKHKLSHSKKALWAKDVWREATGNRVLVNLQNKRRVALADEKKYLAFLTRQAVGHFKKFHPSADPVEVLALLARVLLSHRRKFPDSTLTFEVLEKRVQTILGKPLHTIMRINGRPMAGQNIVTLLRMFAETPQPVPFWVEVSQRLYRTRDSAQAAQELWAQFRRAPIALRCRIATAVLGRSIDPQHFQDLIQVKRGRPATPK